MMTYEGASLTSLEYAKYKAITLKTRLHVLWLAVLNVFTGNSMYLTTHVRAEFGEHGISASTWLNRGDGWKNLSVTFDGKEAVGYVDGERVTGSGR